MDNNAILTDLKQYMFLTRNFQGKEAVEIKKEEIKKEKKEKEKEEPMTAPAIVKPEFFIPEQKDKLFWIYYIIKNGFSSYEYPGNTSFANEKTEKFACIDLVRAKKDLLKTKKIKNLKEHVEDELANRDRIGMKTFIALCIVSGINVLFIHNRKCFELVDDKNGPEVHVVHMTSPIAFKYELDSSLEKLEYYRTELFSWESVDKPIKAISNFKVDELLALCKQLGLTIDKSKKLGKKELYEMILMAL
jgi:hypothetical protein